SHRAPGAQARNPARSRAGDLPRARQRRARLGPDDARARGRRRAPAGRRSRGADGHRQRPQLRDGGGRLVRSVPGELYPFRGRYFDVGGARMHYLDEGTGEPVVMLHGNPTWSFYYRELVRALSPRYRCIVPDHVGMGPSDKPGADRYEYTLERRVDDLGALLEPLGVERDVTLVLHDWGGMIGMAWAARRPERVARLVILNTAAFPLPDDKPFPWPLWLTRTPVGAL